MEITLLATILIVVWYYGHSLKVASEINAKTKSALLTEIVGIKESTILVAENISSITTLLTAADSEVRWGAHLVDVEWKFFNEQKIDPLLKKLEHNGADITSTLNNIEVELERIESSVSAIAAHPAFTGSKDED